VEAAVVAAAVAVIGGAAEDRTTTTIMLLRKSSSRLLHHHHELLKIQPRKTEERLTLALDVPGFASDNINVSTEGDDSCLVIEGSRTNRVGDTFYVQERFVLDEETYKLDTTQGNLLDGVLEITIQKRPKPQPRVISITTHKKAD
jgi:HSP20 family molecular chaperone IbpA